MKRGDRIILHWGVFGLFAFGVFDTLRAREFRWRGGPTIRRADRPSAYRFWTSLVAAVTLLVFLAAVARTLGVESR